MTNAAGARAVVTLLDFEPVGPTHVMVYVVVAERGEVVNEPDVPVMPLGEEEHEVLSVDVQVMTAVWAGDPDAINDGVADANKLVVIVVAGVPAEDGAALVEELPPPHEARPETTNSTANRAPSRIFDLTAMLFFMFATLGNKRVYFTNWN